MKNVRKKITEIFILRFYLIINDAILIIRDYIPIIL